MIILCHNIKDKSMIILYAVFISLWPMLGKEISYFYTWHPKNNDRWIIYSLSLFHSLSLSFTVLLSLYLSLSLSLSLSLYLSLLSLFLSVCHISIRRFYEELKELCVSVITVSLSLLSIFLSGVSNGRFRPC